MNEKTFEQRVADIVVEKLDGGMVERLVEEKLEKGVSEALESLFSYGGDGKKIIQEKIKKVLVPAIENHDFNKYLIKLDSCLTGIVRQTNLADNKKILENFKNLMKEPESKEVKLSQVFREYIKHVEEDIDTSNLEAMCEDGEPYYEHVTATMEVEFDNDRYRTSYEDCTVKISCEQDKDLDFTFRMFKKNKDNTWMISGRLDELMLGSLRRVNSFEIYMAKIDRMFADIIIDTEYESDDDIEPNEKPEWDLN